MLKNVTDLVKGDVVLERGRRFTVRNISVSDSDRNVFVYSTRGELATYELTDDVEVVGSTRERQRDVGPKIKDTYKPRGYTSEELADIERQLDTMKLKLADPASGARQIRLTVLGKPLTVYAIRWDAATREQIRTRTSEVYFHFDEKLGRLELREAQPHGETLWMKKVHKPGELRRAHYAAENFIRTQGLRVVEQRKIEPSSKSKTDRIATQILERMRKVEVAETITSTNVATARSYIDEKASKVKPENVSELMTESIQSVVANEIHRAQESLNVIRRR